MQRNASLSNPAALKFTRTLQKLTNFCEEMKYGEMKAAESDTAGVRVQNLIILKRVAQCLFEISIVILTALQKKKITLIKYTAWAVSFQHFCFRSRDY